MNRTDILEMIRNGESSSVEFKRDDVRKEDVAKEIVAFLNYAGGTVLLGVEDGGVISGTTRDQLEEWVVQLCRDKIEPSVIPFLERVRDLEPGRDILAIQVPAGPDKPYARVHNNRRLYYVRAGRTSQEATREELQRMFQEAGQLHYGHKPVPGAGLEQLDRRRLHDHETRILESETPKLDDEAGWERLLLNLEFATRSQDRVVATIDGLLLFGRTPKRFLPQSGIRALCYSGRAADYAARADEELAAPLAPLLDREGDLIETGLIDQALDFVRRNTVVEAELEGGTRRVERFDYPVSVLREVIVNAVIHRDYSITGADVTLTIFEDRLEVESPGRLPNSATVDALKQGFRYARNQTLVNVMRDYRYVDFRGMGIRQKIIPGMNAHNGTEPDFEVKERSFVVRLWRTRPGGS